MQTGRITSKGQTTIPKAIRDLFALKPGDVVEFTVEGNKIVLSKLRSGASDDYYKGLSDTMVEWNSPEDEDAYRDL